MWKQTTGISGGFSPFLSLTRGTSQVSVTLCGNLVVHVVIGTGCVSECAPVLRDYLLARAAGAMAVTGE